MNYAYLKAFLYLGFPKIPSPSNSKSGQMCLPAKDLGKENIFLTTLEECC